VKKAWDPNRWKFTVDEVSNCVYEAIADDQQGSTIRRVGGDPDELLRTVEEEAVAITRRRREAAAG
jgi:hypothetical protein